MGDSIGSYRIWLCYRHWQECYVTEQDGVQLSNLGTVSVVVFSALSSRAFHGAAPTGVDDNDKHQQYDIDNGNSPPVGLDVLQHAGSAGIAVETELCLGVAPCSTVGVGGP